jgi:hypothetical protein
MRQIHVYNKGLGPIELEIQVKTAAEILDAIAAELRIKIPLPISPRIPAECSAVGSPHTPVGRL